MSEEKQKTQRHVVSMNKNAKTIKLSQQFTIDLRFLI